jgi:hypothetical protein
MKNPDRPEDIHTFFQSMEPDLKQIIAAHPVVTEDGHPCDFIYGLLKACMLENSPIDGRPRWELYFTSPHYQDFPSWTRSMLAGFLKKNRILSQQQTRQALTSAEIQFGMATPSGGWTRARLASWGVPWPPPKGWRKRLEQQAAERQGSTSSR